MKPTIPILYTVLAATAASAGSPLELIDTRAGTDYAVTATAGLFGKGSEEHGQTLPSVGVPHGMNMWTPQTRDSEQKCSAPYYYGDSLLQGFRASHWLEGGCTQDYGSVTIAALTGPLRTLPATRATRFGHADETARPDFYAVNLPDEGITAELTGLSRSAMLRLTYNSSGTGHLVVNPNSDEGQGFIEIDTGRREIRGYNPVHRIYQGWGEPAGFSGYFVIQYPGVLELTSFGTFVADSVSPGSTSVGDRHDSGAYISFDVTAGQSATITAATSFTSIDNARRNMAAETTGCDFGEMRSRAAAAWNECLSCIEVEGGSPHDRAKFYGSLYRASKLPRVVSDADGSYCSFATGSPVRQMPAGHDYYDDFSLWDTYRALHPLLTIIAPGATADMMQSLVLKAEQGGWMPIFPCWGSYTAAMIGDHAAAAIADAAVKGIGGFDLDKAYRYLRRNAFESPATHAEYADGMGRRALQSYLQYGYIPLEDSVPDAFHQREQTSRTLEYAFDDYALARLARLTGHDDDYNTLMQRSLNYRHVIDPQLGYANGRHADGSWAAGTDPFDFNRAITEGAPCHYSWYAPHDPGGLIEALGGPAAFEAKLDSMFTEHRYWHGNEPCHQVAYMFNAVGRRDKTARWVRHIMDSEYLDAPGGLSGNDDAGQMSAWLVFSAMGFYPVCPASGEYWLGAPLFDRITLHAGPEPLIIKRSETPDSLPFYNGQPLPTLRLPHRALTSGGLLTL